MDAAELVEMLVESVCTTAAVGTTLSNERAQVPFWHRIAHQTHVNTPGFVLNLSLCTLVHTRDFGIRPALSQLILRDFTDWWKKIFVVPSGSLWGRDTARGWAQYRFAPDPHQSLSLFAHAHKYDTTQRR